MSENQLVAKWRKKCCETLDAFDNELDQRIANAAEQLGMALALGKKVLACGNGGSHAQAQHFVAELVGRYQHDRGPLAALTLGSELASLTAIANDLNYNDIFARQLAGLAQQGDWLLAISTSGRSENVLNAVQGARDMGVSVVALTGQQGATLLEMSHIGIAVPSSDTPRIQEAHTFVLHAIAELVESAL